jgi:hypothetical protein
MWRLGGDFLFHSTPNAIKLVNFICFEPEVAAAGRTGQEKGYIIIRSNF